MKTTFNRIVPMAVGILMMSTVVCLAQQRGQQRQGQQRQGRGGGAKSVPDHPQAVGEAGIAWYTTWDSGLAEAQRTNRPIFFMSAATTCSGVSGVF